MVVHNFLPQLIAALNRWTRLPKEAEFNELLKPLQPFLVPLLEDFGIPADKGLYEVASGLNWASYREEALRLDPLSEEARARRILGEVERCLGITLKGDLLLFGAFTAMDGYARFERGNHCVYLGVDESHGRGAYLDVLLAHELTHVAREPLPQVWSGFGLSPDMTHDEFVANLPVVEHLFGEGFSCVISELICPREPLHHYVYQTEDSLARVLAHGPAVDRAVHTALRDANIHYARLYEASRYVPNLPRYAHYVWAWLWVSQLLKTRAGNNPRVLLAMPAHDLVEDALDFRLPRFLESPG